MARSADITLKTFLERIWLPAAEKTIRPTTCLNYRLHVERHISPRIGGIRLRRLTPERLNRFYGELLAKGGLRSGNPLSPNTIQRIHATLHRALRDAVRWGYLARNPVDGADPPKLTERVEPSTWDERELSTFLRFVRKDDLYSLWLLLAMTGMRRGEALGLRWGDIDPAAGQVAIRQAVVAVGGQIAISSPKTARGRRVVALDPYTLRVLTRTRKSQKRLSDFIFVDGTGQALSPSWVSKRFRQLVSASGVPRIRLHDLRHTHATLALRAGVHPKIVSERLGHATVALTLDIYSHALPHMQKEAAESIGRLIFGSNRRSN